MWEVISCRATLSGGIAAVSFFLVVLDVQVENKMKSGESTSPTRDEPVRLLAFRGTEMSSRGNAAARPTRLGVLCHPCRFSTTCSFPLGALARHPLFHEGYSPLNTLQIIGAGKHISHN